MSRSRASLAIVALLGLLLFAPVCWTAAGLTAQSESPVAQPVTVVAAEPAEIEDLTPTPVITRGGVIDHLFTDTSDLERPATLEQAITAAAHAAGLTEQLPRLRLEIERLSDPDAENQREDYPYVFGGLDHFFAASVNRQLYQARSRELVELASVLILTAAHVPEDGTPQFRQPAPAAYSLLLRLRALDPASCHVQLNLQFLVTADYAEDDDAARLEGLRAARVCRDDPTPLWLLGQIQISAACARCRVERDVKPVHTAALRTFDLLDRRFPATAWGSAGRGEYWLELAEQSEELRSQPFLARSYYRRALDAFREASSRSRDPAVNLGIARSLDGLGFHDEAVREAERVVRRHPRLVRVDAQYLRMLQRAGRFAEATVAVERQTDLEMPSGLQLIATARGLSHKVPVSMGLLNSAAVWVPLGFGGKGAGSATDTRFIPPHRISEEAGIFGPCRRAGYVRDLILVGRSADAFRTATTGSGLYEIGPGRSCFDESLGRVDGFSVVGAPDWRALAALEAGHLDYERWLTPAESSDDDSEPEVSLPEAKSLLHDARQNLWRFAGDLDRAAEATRRWMAEAPTDPVAVDRLGEIQFLRGQHAAAIASFEEARRLYDAKARIDPEASLGRDRKSPRVGAFLSRLRLGASQATAGQPEAAAMTFDDLIIDLDREATSGADVDEETRYLALSQAGHLALSNTDHVKASAFYARAALIGDESDWYDFAARTGVVENNRALADAKSGRVATALRHAAGAVHIDPGNPVFTETLAFARRIAGDRAGALAAYDAALVLDPSLFTAHNNRGVLLAELGRFDEAANAFRQALSVDPKYAVAWFNLGSLLLEREGLAGLIAGQGSLGRAVVADYGFRDQAPELRYDDTIYRSGLDLSRPLPADWQFSDTVERPVPGLAVVALVALGLKLGQHLGLDQLSNWIAARLLRRREQDRLPWWHRIPAYWSPVVALVAAMVAVAIMFWRDNGTFDLTAPLLVGGTVIVLLLAMAARRMAAGVVGVGLQHGSWTPAVLLGLVLAAFSIPFIPQPVARLPNSEAADRVRWVGLGALAATAALLLTSGYVFGVPLTRQLGVLTVAMLAASAVPVRPLDGGFIRRRSTEIAVSVALLIVSAATILAWI